MKKVCVALCVLVMSFNGYGESVFTWDVTTDPLLISAAFGVFVSPLFVRNEPAQVPLGLNVNDINGLDRSLMFSYNRTLDKISDYGVYGFLLFPALSLIGNITDTNAWLTYGVMYAEAVLLTFGTKDLLKNAIIRYRPYMYSGGVPEGLEDDYYNSFPSGSTSLAFLAAGFLSATFSAEYEDSKWKIPVIAGAYTLAVGIAAARIGSGSHFITDVLVGAAIGSLYGWGVPLLHKRQSSNDSFALNFTGNGIVASLRF
jgi:membrane-associated phospholipid phosphatase